MNILKEILAEAFLIREDASVDAINTAVKNMHPVRITYNGPSGEGRGEREIYPVAYGISTAGNPVVRAFQPQGDTSTDVPAWKFFRIDRIESWDTDNSRHFDPSRLNGFNEKGDESMKTLYAISPIGRAKQPITQQPGKEAEPEKTITSHPVSKGEVQNGGADQNTEKRYYTADDAVNDLLNTTIPKVGPLLNKTVDNVAGQDYNSKENTPAREPVPVTKSEIEGPEAQNEPNKRNTDLYADGTEPVMKNEIEPNAEIQSNGELGNKFKDLTSRMDNLYNDEEEEEK